MRQNHFQKKEFKAKRKKKLKLRGTGNFPFVSCWRGVDNAMIVEKAVSVMWPENQNCIHETISRYIKKENNTYKSAECL